MKNITVVTVISTVIAIAMLASNVYAEQEQQVVDRSALAWGLFYKMMTAAFIVGAVVQGTLVYIIFKFREKKVKSRLVSDER
jgi:heme/copper-type cytochrome/quinol oxidase subunit 2